MYTPINMDKETGIKKKQEFTMDILNNDLFPHCQNTTQKIYFLGYMANRILQASFEMIPQDDRDSYINKRIDLTGTSLNNLFRNNFNRMVKDMEKQVIKEIKTGKGAHNFRPLGDKKHIFLSNRVEPSISLLNMDTLEKVADITGLPSGPDDMDVTPDGKELWVTFRFAKKVGVIDIASRKLMTTIPVGKSPHGISFTRAPHGSNA